MIAVVSRLVPGSGRQEEFARIVRELAQKVRANEPSCLDYRLVRSRHEPDVYLLLERYTDDAALAEHVNATHYVEAVPDLMECLDGLPEIAIYDEVG